MPDVNPITGEVEEPEHIPGTDTELVPLNLSAMSEDELIALFPTPVQAARNVARRAPAALDRYRRKLKTAERDLTVALALGAEKILEVYPRMPMGERRDLARAIDDRVKDAQLAADTAWLEMEYARDFDRMIGRDIDILRSLNANLRGEHR